MEPSLEHLKDWIGRRESDVDEVTAPQVHRLSATLDRDDPKPRPGDPLPAGWHQLLFPRVARHALLGSDGHPERGDFLPPVPLPRRMFAGKRTTFHADLRVGDEVHRESVIRAVSIKQGRTGQMVFVTVRTEMTSPRGLAITEDQDYVYREAAPAGTPPQPPQPAPGKAVWQRIVTPDPVMLFRYSALTFNSHRIHYDRRHAMDVEGYPGLVVHGPLVATLLLDLLRRQHPEGEVREFTFKARRPLFDTEPFSVHGRADSANQFTLWALDPHGQVAVHASATIA